MIWDPSLILVEKWTKAELIRFANEEIAKERERCAKLVASYSGCDQIAAKIRKGLDA